MENYNYFFLFNLLISIISIKLTFAGEFIDLKKLSSCDAYFIILDTGLYLYDFNSNDIYLIYEFKENEYKGSNNKINLNELYYKFKAYIFCLVNEYLFIFKEYTYKLKKYKINEIKNFNYGDYYNILPYEIKNNITTFILAFNNNTDNLFFYYYNFNLNESILEPKVITTNDINVQNKMIRCEINYFSTFIICFYYSNKSLKKYFSSKIFKLKDMEFILDITLNLTETNNVINQIKLAKSYNDKLFVCFLIGGHLSCFINNINHNLYEWEKIKCNFDTDIGTGYKVFYFTESDDFMFVSRTELDITTINNTDNTVKICNQNPFNRQTNDYSLIYRNGYQVINYEKLTNYKKSKSLSIFQDIKLSEYKEKINYVINNSANKEDLISNLNEFIKNDININYIDENLEISMQKDEKIFSFTSPYIQQMNENSNSTTINLGKCEMKLKEYYNLSMEDNLYILKIDTKQQGKNYPLIDYEVFYLMNRTIEILNLSLCEGLNIELSIPVIINDNIEKYNPKSNYYNDICTRATSESNTDIILNDRRNEFINKNMSLCENNCELIDYDYYNKKAKCSCQVKNTLSLDNIELNGKNLWKNFLDIKSITNIEIIKCYKIVFDKNNIKNNYGFFIMIFIIILYFICLFIFYCKSRKKLIDEIIQIIKAKNNINNQLNKNKKIYVGVKNNMKKIKNNIGKISIIKKKSFNKNIKGKNNNVIFYKKNINNKNEIIEKSKKKINKNVNNNNNILEYTDSEMNSLSYKEAIKYDKRNYIQYYFSLIKRKQSLLFSFYPNKDYNSQIIKSFLFFFYYASDMTINALFFTDDTMHKIYVDSGVFNLSYQLPQIIYSTLISGAINFIIEYLSLSENSIISIKTKKLINFKNKKKIIYKMKAKFCLFFIITFILLGIFWYYISCFCCIYHNTQIILIKDSLMSLSISLLYPLFINLVPGIFRICSLRYKKANKSCIYKLSQIFENLL